MQPQEHPSVKLELLYPRDKPPSEQQGRTQSCVRELDQSKTLHICKEDHLY